MTQANDGLKFNPEFNINHGLRQHYDCDYLQLFDLIFVKFFHDLSGQIAVLANFVDIMQDQSELSDNHEMQLIALQNKKSLIANFNFFRRIMQPCFYNMETDVKKEIILIKNFLECKNISLSFSNSQHEALTSNASKFLSFSIYMILHFAIHVQNISICMAKDNASEVIKINANARKITIPHSINPLMCDENIALDADNALYYLFDKICKKFRINTSWNVFDNSIELTAIFL